MLPTRSRNLLPSRSGNLLPSRSQNLLPSRSRDLLPSRSEFRNLPPSTSRNLLPSRSERQAALSLENRGRPDSAPGSLRGARSRIDLRCRGAASKRRRRGPRLGPPLRRPQIRPVPGSTQRARLCGLVTGGVARRRPDRWPRRALCGVRRPLRRREPRRALCRRIYGPAIGRQRDGGADRDSD